MVQRHEVLKQVWPHHRHFARRSLESRLLLQVGDAVYRGWVTDLSVGGMSATVAAPFKAGAEVRLEFDLPGEAEPMRLPAVVRYTDGFRFGFEFRDMATDERTRVLAFVRAISS